jgi:hypothetical protein
VTHKLGISWKIFSEINLISNMELSASIKYLSRTYSVVYNQSDSIISLVTAMELVLDTTFAHPKLLLNGKILALDSSVNLLPTNPTLMLIGSSTKTIQSVHNKDLKYHQASLNYTAISLNRNPIKTKIKNYCLNISVLDGFNDSHRAMDLLHRIRTDYGIRTIMKNNKWNVTNLIEIHPITESSILGYNRNKGGIIALRLRTDLLDGFRNFDSILRIFLHELAHMIYSGHGDDFLQLNRQLNKQYDDYNRGHVLNPTALSTSFLHEMDITRMDGHVLGGRSHDGLEMREVLANSAEMRLTMLEQENFEGCGTVKK